MAWRELGRIEKLETESSKGDAVEPEHGLSRSGSIENIHLFLSVRVDPASTIGACVANETRTPMQSPHLLRALHMSITNGTFRGNMQAPSLRHAISLQPETGRKRLCHHAGATLSSAWNTEFSALRGACAARSPRIAMTRSHDSVTLHHQGPLGYQPLSSGSMPCGFPARSRRIFSIRFSAALRSFSQCFLSASPRS